MKLSALAPRCCEFDLSRLGERRSAVYFLVDNDEIVYVGATLCLEQRIALHVAEGVKQFDRVLWFDVAEDERDATEGALIRALGPRYCFAAPADDTRDAEILARYGLAIDADARARFDAQRARSWTPERRARMQSERARRKQRSA